MTVRRSGVFVLVAGYPPAFLGGGPIRTIEAMVETRSSDSRVRVLTSARDHGCNELLQIPVGVWVRQGRAEVYYADLAGWRGKLRFLAELRQDQSRTLYLNSLFAFWFSIVPLVLWRLRWLRFHRIVLAPRGELDPGALSLRGRKKAAFLRIATALGLYRGILWHASTPLEEANIRTSFPNAIVVVKENETLVRSRDSVDSAKRGRPVTFAYLGRVSEKKRVHILIEAAGLVGREGEFRLVVHGGGDADYIDRCQRLAAEAGADVVFTGPVAHHDVAAVFDEADFACFATAGENFGHVIGEALARGCPVLVGDVTPWTRRVAEGGGVVIAEPGQPSAWAEAMGALVDEAKDSECLLARRRDALQAFKSWELSRPAGTFLDLLEGDGA